jgi:aspartyl-tRNA(Asn)/glutamyl-tRNA(Gln) amidotransferase subunit A
LRLPNEDVLSGIDSGIRGLRIGVPRGYFFEQLEEEVAAAVDEAIAELGRLGARVREVEISGVQEAVGGLFGHVLAEAQEIHAHALRTRGQDFGPDLQALLGSPAPDTAALMAGLRARDALTAATRQVLEEVDVLVTPTTPITAVPIGQESVSYGGVEEPVLMAMIRCTAPFNASHLPALSLPCGFSPAGLPVGLQIVGRPFDERLVLRVGHAYERSMDWHLRTPDL